MAQIQLPLMQLLFTALSCSTYQFSKTDNPMKVSILNSPVFEPIPWLKLHHIIVLRDEDGITYGVDFSPKNQTSWKTLSQLFFGLKVPAEIRVQVLSDPKHGVNLCKTMRPSDIVPILQHSTTDTTRLLLLDVDFMRPPTYSLGESTATKKLLFRIFKHWDLHMNLYHHNCQHFSAYVRNIIQQDDVCLV